MSSLKAIGRISKILFNFIFQVVFIFIQLVISPSMSFPKAGLNIRTYPGLLTPTTEAKELPLIESSNIPIMQYDNTLIEAKDEIIVKEDIFEEVSPKSFEYMYEARYPYIYVVMIPNMLHSRGLMNDEINEVNIMEGVDSLLNTDIFNNIDATTPPHLYAISYPYSSKISKSRMYPIDIEISEYTPNLFEEIEDIELEELMYVSEESCGRNC